MVNQTYQNTTKISEEISPNTDSSSSLTFFILLNPIVQKSAVADLILSHIRNVHFIWYLGCTFNVKYSFSALNSCPLSVVSFEFFPRSLFYITKCFKGFQLSYMHCFIMGPDRNIQDCFAKCFTMCPTQAFESSKEKTQSFKVYLQVLSM